MGSRFSKGLVRMLSELIMLRSDVVLKSRESSFVILGLGFRPTAETGKRTWDEGLGLNNECGSRWGGPLGVEGQVRSQKVIEE